MRNSPRPRVSVVIPSYNHAAFLETTIRSVAEQSYRPLELVVVDDGSTDDSPALLRRLFDTLDLDGVQLIEQTNRGAHAAVTRGIEASRGEVVSLLDSDDFYHPQRIERLQPWIAEGRHLLAFSGVNFVDQAGAALPSSNAWPQWYSGCLDDTVGCPTVGYGLLVHNFSVSSSNFLFRRELYDQVGGFSNLRFSLDWDFLIRSVHYGEPAFVDEPLLNYRIHDDNTTERVRDRLKTEGVEALERYMALVRREPSPNPLAPSPENWPSYFDRFGQSHKLFFDPESSVLDYWDS
ncbi:MAG: glycosyltransferase [Acidobacteriota bacterium]